jgi:RNA polymerase sigma-70 factor, ECF subfamily
LAISRSYRIGMPKTGDIIERVLAGQADAFLEILSRYEDGVRAFVASKVNLADDVQDVTQDIFIAAFQRLHSFDRSREFKAWLNGIARHKIMNYWRSVGRRRAAMQRLQVEADLLYASEWAMLSERKEMVDTLHRCIDKLPERSRRVVQAGLDGRPVEELANEYRTSVAAVYNLQYRANKKLRVYMRQACE